MSSIETPWGELRAGQEDTGSGKGEGEAEGQRRPKLVPTFCWQAAQHRSGRASIRDHAAANNFPDLESWAQIRSYMVHTGAPHEAMVGARIAWREFRRG